MAGSAWVAATLSLVSADACDDEYLVTGAAVNPQFTNAQINAILKAHNDARRRGIRVGDLSDKAPRQVLEDAVRENVEARNRLIPDAHMEWRDVIDELMRDAAAAGATVLFASHELERAHDVATRTVTISGGVVEEGTT